MLTLRCLDLRLESKRGMFIDLVNGAVNADFHHLSHLRAWYQEWGEASVERSHSSYRLYQLI